MFTEAKITEIYCIADDFCKEFASLQAKFMLKDKKTKRRNKPNRMNDAEIMVILILFHSGGFRCFKRYYIGHVCKCLQSLFPDVASYNRFVELEKEVLFPLAIFLNKSAYASLWHICFFLLQVKRMKDKRTIEELLGLFLSGNLSRQIWELEGKGLQEDKVSLAKARQILKRQSDNGVITLSYHDPNYPARFHNIGKEAPPLIHLLGNKDLLHADKCVAIVGARCADRSGLNAAYWLARQFATEGYVIVSGLALGCDTAAHRGCLDVGGKTIAIVASGLNITHPKVNKTLQDEIVQSEGAALSEHPFGVKANPTRLVARCRLQAALSQMLIVTQCPIISGTMYAVSFALKYGQCAVYTVKYEKYNELNSGNEYLLDCGVAQPIMI